MCKICGFNTEKFNHKGITYEKCLNCMFIAKSEINMVDSKTEYERYLKHTNDNNASYVEYQKKFYFEIKQFLGKKSLDFGCGNNHILSTILNEEKYDNDYYDLFFYPKKVYLDNKYDSIILEEVIEHLKNPLNTLIELKACLNDNGVLIIKTEFIKNDFINWWYIRDITHISFFNKRTFEIISELLGLSIIYCNEKNLIILKKVKVC